MKTVNTYRWRYTERGRVKTTRFHCSWEDIRHENPDATPVEGTLIVRREAESDQEAMDFASGGNANTNVAPG